jgi:hypothetical protein
MRRTNSLPYRQGSRFDLWQTLQIDVKTCVTVTIRDVTGLHVLLYRRLHDLFSSFLFALLLLYVLYVLLFSFDVISYISFRPS